MSTGNDVAYKSVLQGKSYMMGVSPYFYTCMTFTIRYLGARLN